MNSELRQCSAGVESCVVNDFISGSVRKTWLPVCQYFVFFLPLSPCSHFLPFFLSLYIFCDGLLSDLLFGLLCQLSSC